MNKFLLSVSILFVTLSVKQCDSNPSITKSLSFSVIKTQDSTFYNLISNSPADIEVEINFRNNEHSGIKLKEFSLLKSYDSITGVIRFSNLLLEDINENDLLSKIINTKYHYGDSKLAKHNDDYLYSLPIEIGKKVSISQGFNGQVSHTAVHSKYAIDFDIPVGTKIYAAREGVVVYALSHFKKSGGNDYVKKANKIVILHNDGTFAAYSHLMFEGTLVKKGDFVKRGQHIGYSGNTGFSRGPHLHFAVRLPKDICVPIYFEGYENKIFKKGNYIQRLK